MRKTLILVALLGLGILISAGCGKKQQVDQEPVTKASTVQSAPTVKPGAAAYYCPMDTDIVSDKPGKCSKCGMDLIPKPAEPK